MPSASIRRALAIATDWTGTSKEIINAERWSTAHRRCRSGRGGRSGTRHRGSAGVEFIEAVARRLNGNFGNGPESGEWTAIRTRLVGSRESSFLSARRSYLSWDASTRTWIETTRAPSSQVLELRSNYVN